ncbi:serine/threonine-protein kinase [Kitasatospora sp. NPDC004615]|uniref:serine/threonine-protein kinase n=1 Tax=Kitasatospora sp. NPDC004615 TaxID=3364017 RepID=UPI0036AE420D
MQSLASHDPTHIGPFRTAGVLGQGGMGQVLLGVAPDGRLVAIKRVHADLAEDPGFRSRFRREVDASRRVSGAYAAPVIAADPDAPTPWLASLFLAGPTLAEALEAGGALPEQTVRLLAAGLAQALAEVHRVGLVHRDLKPSNVLLTADGVRVVDFGIARAADHETVLTRTGAVIGSPAFMSPEQVRGEQPGPASDVFSLGVTLVTAATGRSPYAGDSPLAVMHAVAHGVPDLAAVPAGLRRIVDPCLANEPADRPTSGQLLELVGPLAPTARPWPASVYAQIEEKRSTAARLAQAAPPAAPAPAVTASVATAPTMAAPAPAVTASVATAPTMTAPVATLPAPRRRPRWLVPVIASCVVLATVAAVVLTAGPDKVYQAVAPDPVPTPGSTPLAQVADKYTKTLPTCAQADRSIKAPADFGMPSGNSDGVGQEPGPGGQQHPANSCFWDSRSGDEVEVDWNLFLSRPGGLTGAQLAKQHYEGMYLGAKTPRDPNLGIGEEGMWYATPDDANCELYVRDVNVEMFIMVKGVHYPRGAVCQNLAKDMARQGLAAVAAL